MADRVDLDELAELIGDVIDSRSVTMHGAKLRKELDDKLDVLFSELRSHREREAAGGWVACSEQLPINLADVLLHVPGMADAVSQGYRDGEAFLIYDQAGVERLMLPVVAWRPLPPPPEPTP